MFWKNLTRRNLFFVNSLKYLLVYNTIWDMKVNISEEIYVNFWFIMYILRMFGTFPFAVVKKSNGLFLKFSPYYALYSYTLWLFIIGASYYGQIDDLFLSSDNSIGINFSTDKIVFFLTIVGYSSVVFGGVFVTNSNFLKFFDYMRCINQVDYAISIAYSKSDKYIPLIIVVLLSLYSVLIHILHLCVGYVLANKTINLTEILKKDLAFHVVILMANLIDYYNMQLAIGLRKRFIRLNELLQTECEAFCKGRKRERRNHQIVFVEPIYFGTVQKLINLRETYLKLSDGANILNNFLGPNSLFGILSATVLLIVSPYYTILILQGKRTGVFEKGFRISILLKSIIRVILVIEPWHACTPQLEATKNLVCKLLSMNVGLHYRKEVRLFGVACWLRQIKFTACDLFNVDRLLYSSIIGTMTTSLVVFLQAEEEEIGGSTQPSI